MTDRTFRFQGLMLALGLVACEGAVVQDDSSSIERARPQALQGAVTFQRGGCNASDLSARDEADFRSILADTIRMGGPAATSPAMYQCLRSVMIDGGFTFPADVASGTWGPFQPDLEPNDLFNHGVLKSATIADKRRLQAISLWNFGKSILDVEGRCSGGGGNGAFAGPRIYTSWITPEVVNFNLGEIRGAASDQRAGGATRTSRMAGLAGLIWHEVAHVHGYGHDDTGVNHRTSAPFIFGACLTQVLRGSTSCTISCPAGEAPVVNDYTGGDCTCRPDPAVPQEATAVVTQSSGVRDFAVDSAGRAYILLSSGAWRHPTDTAFFGTPAGQTISALHAGGTDLYAKTTSNGVYRATDAGWETIRSPASSGVDVAVDDLGSVYLSTSAGVSVCRPGSTTVQTIGGPAAAIFAGGDRVYGTVPSSGDVYMYDHDHDTWWLAGVQGAQFAVDARGALHALTPDRQAVNRNHRDGTGNNWRNVGGPAASITAGTRLYAEGFDGVTRELHPNGTWSDVAVGMRVKERGGAIYGLKNGALSRITH